MKRETLIAFGIGILTGLSMFKYRCPFCQTQFMLLDPTCNGCGATVDWKTNKVHRKAPTKPTLVVIDGGKPT